MDFSSAPEVRAKDLSPLSRIIPRILAELNHLDLSDRAVLKGKTFVGGGSYGDIWRAEAMFADQGETKVAVKRLRFYLDVDIQTLFEKEIYVWAKLRHPNILPLLGYAFDNQTGFPLLISTWIGNGSAWEFVHSHPTCDLMHLVIGIARGLSYLHDKGVVHSDIKSDNILVADTGDALICDFGCSRMLAASRTLANISTGITGTPRYLAYELITIPGSTHSKASDVWAFGMTVFELLERERPYAHMSDTQVMAAIMNRVVPSLSEGSMVYTSLEIRRKIWNVCVSCWKHDPDLRVDMSWVLERFLQDLSEGDTSSEGTAESETSHGSPELPEGSPPPHASTTPSESDDNLSLGTLSSVSSISTLYRIYSDTLASFLGGVDLATLPYDLKTRGDDWVAIFNPSVKRELDVILVRTLRAHPFLRNSIITSVRFSPDGKLLATSGQGIVQIHNVQSGAITNILFEVDSPERGDSFIRSVCFSPDGNLLAVGLEDRTVKLWDISNNRIQRVFEGHNREISSLEFTNDGKFVVSGSGDDTLRIWDIETGTHRILKTEVAEGTGVGITSISISPDGRLLASAHLDSVARLWDLQSGQLLNELKGHQDSVFSVAFTPDGKGVISGSLDKVLKAWDISGLLASPSQSVSSTLVSSMDSKSIPVIEGEKLKCITGLDFIGHTDYVIAAKSSPDMHWLLSGSKDRSARIWDLRTGVAQALLMCHTNSIITVDFSPKGGLFATGGGDNETRLWRYTEV